jgi:hypothetical protein
MDLAWRGKVRHIQQLLMALAQAAMVSMALALKALGLREFEMRVEPVCLAGRQQVWQTASRLLQLQAAKNITVLLHCAMLINAPLEECETLTHSSVICLCATELI